jgi:hypothetical protein
VDGGPQQDFRQLPEVRSAAPASWFSVVLGPAGGAFFQGGKRVFVYSM